MIPAKLQISKLLFIALALSCHTSTIGAGKLSKRQTSTTTAEIAMTNKATDLMATDAATAIEEGNKDADNGENNVNTEITENNFLQSLDDTSFSVWGIVRGMWNWIKEDINKIIFSDDGQTTAVAEGRTFGKIRQIQKALIPLAFKFGVLSAMMVFLVAVALKTLFFVKVLIVMNLLALLAKFFTLKTGFGHVEHVVQPHPPVWNWNPHVSSGWQSEPPFEHHNNKEIHLHIHGGQVQPHVTGYTYSNAGPVGQSHGWERRNDPYSAYETMALQGQQNEILPNDLKGTISSVTNGKQYIASFPSNHRMR